MQNLEIDMDKLETMDPKIIKRARGFLATRKFISDFQFLLVDGPQHGPFLNNPCIPENIMDMSVLVLRPGSYDEIVEERSNCEICGFPCCGSKLKRPTRREYFRIQRRSILKCDVSKYCSEDCQKKSEALKERMEDVPWHLKTSHTFTEINEAMRIVLEWGTGNRIPPGTAFYKEDTAMPEDNKVFSAVKERKTGFLKQKGSSKATKMETEMKPRRRKRPVKKKMKPKTTPTAMETEQKNAPPPSVSNVISADTLTPPVIGLPPERVFEPVTEADTDEIIEGIEKKLRFGKNTTHIIPSYTENTAQRKSKEERAAEAAASSKQEGTLISPPPGLNEQLAEDANLEFDWIKKLPVGSVLSKGDSPGSLVNGVAKLKISPNSLSTIDSITGYKSETKCKRQTSGGNKRTIDSKSTMTMPRKSALKKKKIAKPTEGVSYENKTAKTKNIRSLDPERVERIRETLPFETKVLSYISSWVSPLTTYLIKGIEAPPGELNFWRSDASVNWRQDCLETELKTHINWICQRLGTTDHDKLSRSFSNICGTLRLTASLPSLQQRGWRFIALAMVSAINKDESKKPAVADAARELGFAPEHLSVFSE